MMYVPSLNDYRIDLRRTFKSVVVERNTSQSSIFYLISITQLIIESHGSKDKKFTISFLIYGSLN